MNILSLFKGKRSEPLSYKNIHSKEDFENSILGPWIDPNNHSKGKKKSGVVLGMNPFTHKPILDNSKNHVLVVGKERSGKTTGPVISTALTWDKSVYFYDPTGDVYNITSKYRHNNLNQKVIKFEPFSEDDSSASWNPIAEIDFRTPKEATDLKIISDYILKGICPDAETHFDPFWINSTSALLQTLLLYLAYKNNNEGKDIPTLYDAFVLLDSVWYSSRSYYDFFNEIMRYSHITIEEYFNSPNLYESMFYNNYIRDFSAFEEHLQYIFQSNGEIPEDYEIVIKSQEELKQWIMKAYNNEKLKDEIDFTMEPYNQLLIHPIIYENIRDLCNIGECNENTLEKIFLSVYGFLCLYRNPVLRKNLSKSDFSISELLNLDNPISLYYIDNSQYNSSVRNGEFIELFNNILFYKIMNKKEIDIQEPTLLLVYDNVQASPSGSKFYSITKNISFLESYGIKTLITIKMFDALKYFAATDIDEKILLENLKIKICLSLFYGTELPYFVRLSKSGVYAGSTFWGINKEKFYLEEEDFLCLPSDKSLIFIPSQPVFPVDKISYYKHMKDKMPG